MVKIHKKSKRLTCRMKHKIEKKVREHKRKVRKENKNKSHKSRKDPGVPNSFPFKEQVLKEAEEHRRRLEEEREKQRMRAKQDRHNLLAKKRNLESMVQDAQKRGDTFDKKKTLTQKAKDYSGGKAVENSLKTYYREFKKVVSASDVILQVLDARDPLGSRCAQVEEAVLSAGTNKKIVLLLNKIDLVPKENVEAWLKYLRNEFPTIAFKASTQVQSANLSRSKVPLSLASNDLRKSSRCLGAEMLMKLLGNYCRNKDIRTAITVGVVGFPNTGKSSIINSLKRCKACSVGATPGVTKTMQEINLDKHVKILDSPGIVMATGTSDAHVILRNCVKVESIEDPITPVEVIMKRCPKDKLILHYNIPTFSSVEEFLGLLAKKQGKLKKGGIPNVTQAARTVLTDWNSGKITYYTHPPETQTTHLSAEIVQEMSKEFDIEALLSDEIETLKGLKPGTSSNFAVDSSGPMEGLVEEHPAAVSEKAVMEVSDKEAEEDDDDDLNVVVPATTEKAAKSQSRKAPESKPKKNPEQELEGNQQLNLERQKAFKKMKKKRKRTDAVAGKLSDALEGAMSGFTAGSGSGDDGDEDDSYNFDVDYH